MMIVVFADNYMNHAGENVSVDINFRVLDGQNPQQQQVQQYNAQTERQGSDRLSRTTTDALERHIRKMERSINQVRYSRFEQSLFPLLLLVLLELTGN
jgi:hypothetical protein